MLHLLSRSLSRQPPVDFWICQEPPLRSAIVALSLLLFIPYPGYSLQFAQYFFCSVLKCLISYIEFPEASIIVDTVSSSKELHHIPTNLDNKTSIKKSPPPLDCRLGSCLVAERKFYSQNSYFLTQYIIFDILGKFSQPKQGATSLLHLNFDRL